MVTYRYYVLLLVQPLQSPDLLRLYKLIYLFYDTMRPITGSVASQRFRGQFHHLANSAFSASMTIVDFVIVTLFIMSFDKSNN